MQMRTVRHTFSDSPLQHYYRYCTRNVKPWHEPIETDMLSRRSFAKTALTVFQYFGLWDRTKKDQKSYYGVADRALIMPSKPTLRFEPTAIPLRTKSPQCELKLLSSSASVLPYTSTLVGVRLVLAPTMTVYLFKNFAQNARQIGNSTVTNPVPPEKRTLAIPLAQSLFDSPKIDRLFAPYMAQRLEYC